MLNMPSKRQSSLNELVTQQLHEITRIVQIISPNSKMEVTHLTQNPRNSNDGAKPLTEVCLSMESEHKLPILLPEQWPHMDYRCTGGVWVGFWMAGVPLMFPDHSFAHTVRIPSNLRDPF